MELLYKPDWEQTKERFLAWWDGEIIGRCAIAVTAPRSGISTAEAPVFPSKIEDRWTDFEFLHAVNEYRMSRTFYGGEALPVWNAGYPGWDMIQTYMGTPIHLGEDTGWHNTIMAEGELTEHDYKKLTVEPDNTWWSFSKKLHGYALEEAKGKSLPGLQDLGSSGDTLAAMRGSERLLFDLVDCPEYVREFDQYLMKKWTEVYEELFSIVKEGSEGSTSWFNLWCPGRFYPIQNDFSYMISPKMFNDIFLRTIETQTDFLDKTVYHVDGVDAFAHVDALCELPRLQALQILPGAGKPSPLYYMDVLKKVQSKGKNLHITIAADEVEIALSELSSKGLFIDTCCNTEEEAKYLLKMAEKWSMV